MSTSKEVFLTTADGIEFKRIDLPLSAWEVRDGDITGIKVFPAGEYHPENIYFFYENAEVVIHESNQKL